MRVGKGVESAPGAIGYSLGTDLFRLTFYTLSAWQDRASLEAFVHAPVHVAAMQSERPKMGRPGRFTFFTLRGDELPPDWKETLRRGRAERA